MNDEDRAPLEPGRFAAHWVFGRIAPDVRRAVVDFWLREGAIASPDEAWRRSWEAACILGDPPTGAIAGVCTVAVGLDDAGRTYGYVRIYIGKANRRPGVGVRLAKCMLDGFEAMAGEPGAPRRIVANLENPKLASHGGTRLLAGLGFSTIGKTSDGQWLIERQLGR